MNKLCYSTELIIRVAKLYYMDNLTQESVARKLNISKYKVNRILKKAKENSIVQINIMNPDNKDIC